MINLKLQKPLYSFSTGIQHECVRFYSILRDIDL